MTTPPLRLNAVFARAPTLRDATDDDRPFLLALYASTRADELARTGWSAETRQVFVQMQYAAQHADYLRRHPAPKTPQDLTPPTPASTCACRPMTGCTPGSSRRGVAS